MDGRIEDFRVTKGVARYTSDFTPPTSALSADVSDITGSDDVVLLLDGDGTSGSTTFTDKSSSSHTITANGDTQVDTAVKKFGTGSIEFDGTGDYLDVSVGSGLTFDGDFTVEAWVYPDATGTYQAIIDGRASNNAYQNYYFGLANVSGTLRTEVILASGATGRTGTTNAVPTGQWSHIAWVRNSGVITTYVNGVADATTKTDSATLTPTNFRIGAAVGTPNFLFDGYLDDIRVTKGAALYPDLGRITPIPTAALPTTGTVAGATRPTRKWGGLVGRSLIVTTTTELTELPHSPSASIYKGDTTQGSQTLSTNGTDPTFSGSGIDSYHTPLNSSYYSYSPATAATAWTAFYDWEMNSATYPYLASYGTTSGAVRRFYTHNNDIKVYKGSGVAAGDFPIMIPGLTDGQRYRAAFRWDGTNLRSYLVSGTAKITVLPSASATFTQDFDLDGNTHSIGVNSTNFNAAEDLESPLYAYGFYESALTDSQMVDVFNALNNIGSESETLVKTGVLSLAEHYQSKL